MYSGWGFTLDDEMNDGIGTSALVHEARVLAVVVVAHRIELERVRLGVERHALAVVPHDGRVVRVLDELHGSRRFGRRRSAAARTGSRGIRQRDIASLAAPLEHGDERQLAHAGAREVHESARLHHHRLVRERRDVCNGNKRERVRNTSHIKPALSERNKGKHGVNHHQT